MIIRHSKDFLKVVARIKHNGIKMQVQKQVEKIIEDPFIGKPMQHDRKGTRELYVGSYRIAYSYFKEEGVLMFLAIYHKDKQ